jgi:uncharacterized protein (TIGR02594 family)
VYRTAHARHAYRHTRRHFADRHDRQASYVPFGFSPISPAVEATGSSRPRLKRSAALARLRRFANTQASVTPSVTPHEPGGGMAMSGSSSGLVMEARHYLGGNPTGRGSLWCARFMNMVLERTGHHGTGSDMANSFASYGQRISGPQVGAIAVMGRRGGGHVGIITGIDASGNPIMISGNNGNRVREAPVSRSRIYAYVMPN